MIRSVCEFGKGIMDRSFRQAFGPINDAGGNEINRRTNKDSFKSVHMRNAACFGGHRLPLQYAQPVQQLLVNPVEAAVAEHRHDVVWL
jgi:hypothetical protein